MADPFSTADSMFEYLHTVTPQVLADLPAGHREALSQFMKNSGSGVLAAIMKANPASFAVLTGNAPLPPPSSGLQREDLSRMSPLQLARLLLDNRAEFDRLTRPPSPKGF